ncbi:MAG: glycoside hydrolase family 76 protein [Gordonia sp. (in: high G+C Gram-positive bacteria)]|uniref:glycoside hydrolase family 76 protein n=1 Tax=Gordonia sp. (in: high G+C Gram-positive bacteria) TaxID=84139 RepID=UPI0039E27288
MTAEVESPRSPDPGTASIRRAEAAVDALRDRHLRRIGHVVPGTRIGVITWPPPGRMFSKQRLTASWHYWWQAHLIDVLVDAARFGDARAAGEANGVARGLRIRNVGRWTNQYYDDMAWLAVSLERAGRHLSRGRRRRAQEKLTGVLYDAWTPELGGGIPWRTTDHFFNVPANGPAGIVLARRGRVERAVATADWIASNLVLPSGLVADGFWPNPDGTRREENNTFTYCQGVALGLWLETYRLTGEERHLANLSALLDVVARRQASDDGVLIGHGGGDGGLFTGILARYLALIATDLPDTAPDGDRIRDVAGGLVTASADAAWAARAEVDGLPVFGPNWRKPAVVPDARGRGPEFIAGAVRASQTPERDLSVQLSAAMLMTAAASVTNRLPEHTV